MEGEKRRHGHGNKVAAFVEVDSDRDVLASETKARSDVANSRQIGALIGQEAVLPSMRREVGVDLAQRSADGKVVS